MTRRLSHFLVRFAVAYAVLAALAVVCERPLNHAVAPWVEFGLSLHPDLQVRAVSSEGSRLKADVMLTARGPARSGARVKASVVANGDLMFVGPLLALSVVLAWSFRSSRERAAALALGTLFALILAAHDISSAMVQGLTLALGDIQGPVARFYSFFLDSGGRQLLALACAGAAIHVAALVGRHGIAAAGAA